MGTRKGELETLRKLEKQGPSNRFEAMALASLRHKYRPSRLRYEFETKDMDEREKADYDARTGN